MEVEIGKFATIGGFNGKNHLNMRRSHLFSRLWSPLWQAKRRCFVPRGAELGTVRRRLNMQKDRRVTTSTNIGRSLFYLSGSYYIPTVAGLTFCLPRLDRSKTGLQDLVGYMSQRVCMFCFAFEVMVIHWFIGIIGLTVVNPST